MPLKLFSHSILLSANIMKKCCFKNYLPIASFTTQWTVTNPECSIMCCHRVTSLIRINKFL